jgi:hypothetical protein
MYNTGISLLVKKKKSEKNIQEAFIDLEKKWGGFYYLFFKKYIFRVLLITLGFWVGFFFFVFFLLFFDNFSYF